ncbi:hypothetical protein G9C98_000084 [Cotesia typhae]|uniref:Hsp90 chaperone protein kinase-targeting subunit n=1 Tax=Cotesia typhae TaxID=2053667 RepID=A0A8J5VCJ3_9HYME|nr:hypothetical protein G9C98_000084 [Cotesia typhae]
MVDYSKWKDIEISDDEDDTHPNIDTPSLFRWRHQARVERMEEQKKQKEELERVKEQTLSKVEETKKKIATLEKEKANPEDLNALKKSLQELELEEQKVKDKEEELKKKEKLTPWNVDTIAQAGFTKTVINTKPRRRPDEEDQALPDDVREMKMKEFVKTNEKSLKKFGMLRRYDDKLSKQLDVDPRACVGSFFSRIQIADVEYKKSFDDELEAFKERIRKRAQEKVAEALKEAEEEERKARLGPGGLDPVEVFESLPEPLQKCFEAQDIPLLQQTIAAMPEDEAKYHMRRCIDSGLWVPDAKSKESQPTESESLSSEAKPETATPTPDPE